MTQLSLDTSTMTEASRLRGGVGKTAQLTDRFSCIAMTLLCDPWQERFYFECKITPAPHGSCHSAFIQPLGGAVTLSSPCNFTAAVGSYNYTTVESLEENDLRVYLAPSSRLAAIDYCVRTEKKLSSANVVRELCQEIPELSHAHVCAGDFSVTPVADKVQQDSLSGGYRAIEHGEQSARVFFLHHAQIISLSLCKHLAHVCPYITSFEPKELLAIASRMRGYHRALQAGDSFSFLVALDPKDLVAICREQYHDTPIRGVEPIRWMLPQLASR